MTSIETTIKAFITSKRASKKAQNTIRMYSDRLQLFWFFARRNKVLDIEQITPTFIEEWLLDMEDDYTESSIKTGFVVLKGFLLWVEKREILGDDWKNPIKKVQSPKMTVNPLDPAKMEDVKKVLDTCNRPNNFRDVRDNALIRLLVSTGMRAFEALSIELENVDLERGRIKLEKSKTGEHRVVWITNGTLEALKHYVVSHPHQNRQYLFTVTDNGGIKKLEYDGLKQSLIYRSEMAGVKPYLKAHSLRRLFALQSKRNGASIPDIMQMGGWKSIEVLTKRYLKLDEKDAERSFSKYAPSVD